MLEKLNTPNTIIIIGRAHSGTRLLPGALAEARVYIGEPLNIANDLLPVDDIYTACRMFGDFVKKTDKYDWDFSETLSCEIPGKFVELLTDYLTPLVESKSEKVGWKNPVNTLCYPWLVRLLPKATFIFWVRHPEGSSSKMSGVDRLERWNIPCKKYWFHEWNFRMRAVSWKYHYDIVNNTPQPENFLKVRFEDYVLEHNKTNQEIGNTLGLALPIQKLNTEKVKPLNMKFKKKYKFLEKAMEEMGYE